MKRVSYGFTLIELMIVVVIIGILAAVGIPQYQNYVARSQAAEGFSLAGGLKTALAEYRDTNGEFPDGTTDAHTAIGVEGADKITGKYITGVEVSNDGSGTITATFGPASQHDGKFLRLTPTATDGAVYFDCTTDIDESYRPSGCEEGVGTSLGPATTATTPVSPPKVAWEETTCKRDLSKKSWSDIVYQRCKLGQETWPENPACWDPNFGDSGGWVAGKSRLYERYSDQIPTDGTHWGIGHNVGPYRTDAQIANWMAIKDQALPDCNSSNCRQIFNSYINWMHHSGNEGKVAKKMHNYSIDDEGNQFHCAS